MSQERAPQQPQLPIVLLDAPTLRANIVFVNCNPGNGSITLYAIDQREAPAKEAGGPLVLTNFEVGRFELTPRALRGLLDSVLKSAENFKALYGRALPTIPEFEAAGAMTGLLQNLLDKPKEQPQ